MVIKMDRHICRAKRKDNGEWVQGVYYKQTHFYGNESERYYIITSTEALDYDQALEYFEVDPDTICQCIGYYDSHETPIFQNDIVGFGRSGSYRHKELVWYCKEMNMLTSVPLDGIEFNGYDYCNSKYPNVEYSTLCLMLKDPYGDFSEIKVLGNIIDNPELLEDEKIEKEHD